MRTLSLLIVAGALLSGCAFDNSWILPRGAPVKDDGPRSYRFTVEHSIADTKGQVIKRERFSGDYTRGLPGGDVAWKNVSHVDFETPDGPAGPPQKREFMEGFRYHNDGTTSLAADFFKGFPATAVPERNLVWDTGMIESFGQTQLEHLILNQPYRLAAGNGTVNMPGVGTFHNRDIQLMWMGRSRRNGRDCALIGYSAYFNRLNVAVVDAGIYLEGRSHYWGEIWVALQTLQIEYATLHEDVLGTLKLGEHQPGQLVNVFRTGIFEPLPAR